MLAGLFGGVIQTTPYIGQPAYKAMGGRAAYTLATAMFIGLAGGLGWFAHLFEWLPEAACFPILVFVGLEIGAQSFRATPTRHYAALALAMLPALAYLATIPMDMVLGPEQQLALKAGAMILALRCLSSGFIVTSLLWASALAAVLDRQMFRAAAYLGVAAVCSLVGIIHSPLAPAVIGWPWDVYARMLQTPEMQSPAMLCQSPYHWAGGYVLAGIALVVIGWMSAGRVGQDPGHPGTRLRVAVWRAPAHYGLRKVIKSANSDLFRIRSGLRYTHCRTRTRPGTLWVRVGEED